MKVRVVSQIIYTDNASTVLSYILPNVTDQTELNPTRFLMSSHPQFQHQHHHQLWIIVTLISKDIGHPSEIQDTVVFIVCCRYYETWDDRNDEWYQISDIRCQMSDVIRCQMSAIISANEWMNLESDTGQTTQWSQPSWSEWYNSPSLFECFDLIWFFELNWIETKLSNFLGVLYVYTCIILYSYGTCTVHHVLNAEQNHIAGIWIELHYCTCTCGLKKWMK